MNGKNLEDEMDCFTDWVLKNVPEFTGNRNFDKEKYQLYNINGKSYGPIPIQKFQIFF